MAYYSKFQKRYQSFDELDKMIGNRDRRLVGPNTYFERIYSERIDLTLHGYTIAQAFPSHVWLSHAGWQTRLTKDRLNTYFNAYVFSIRGEWFVYHPKLTETFPVDVIIPKNLDRFHPSIQHEGVTVEWSGKPIKYNVITLPETQRSKATRKHIREKINKWLDWWEYHVRSGFDIKRKWATEYIGDKEEVRIIGNNRDLHMNYKNVSINGLSAMLASADYAYITEPFVYDPYVSPHRFWNTPEFQKFFPDERIFKLPPNHKTTMKELKPIKDLMRGYFYNRIIADIIINSENSGFRKIHWKE